MHGKEKGKKSILHLFNTLDGTNIGYSSCSSPSPSLCIQLVFFCRAFFIFILIYMQRFLLKAFFLYVMEYLLFQPSWDDVVVTQCHTICTLHTFLYISVLCVHICSVSTPLYSVYRYVLVLCIPSLLCV